MKRYEVNSSEFSSFGYDLPTSTLEAEYQSGEVYRYFDVPGRLVLEMLEASSVADSSMPASGRSSDSRKCDRAVSL